MNNYKEEAQKLFQAVADRNSLKIETVEDDNFSLFMRIPEQIGLFRALELGLQNNDEINIGYSGFWSYIYPFPKVKTDVESVIDGIINNTTRLNIETQGKRTVSRRLEILNGCSWDLFYTEVVKFRVPLVTVNSHFLYNTHDGCEPYLEVIDQHSCY